MCTVTFYPLSSTEFVLTTSRDESPNRATLPPEVYTHDGFDLLYPKDKVAGGTWVGGSSRKRVLTRMKGGYVAHKRKNSYRWSRGGVGRELLKTETGRGVVSEGDVQGVEPMPIVSMAGA